MSDHSTNQSGTLVVGIGSPHGDDRAGWLIAEHLQKRGPNRFDIKIAKSPVDLLDWLEGVSRLVICDACHGLGEIGRSHRWTWPAPEITTIAMSGTHNLALPTVLALAEKLGQLPDEVVIQAIEGANRTVSAEISHEVAGAIVLLADQIAVELNDTLSTLQAGECTNNR